MKINNIVLSAIESALNEEIRRTKSAFEFSKDRGEEIKFLHQIVPSHMRKFDNELIVNCKIDKVDNEKLTITFDDGNINEIKILNGNIQEFNEKIFEDNKRLNFMELVSKYSNSRNIYVTLIKQDNPSISEIEPSYDYLDFETKVKFDSSEIYTLNVWDDSNIRADGKYNPIFSSDFVVYNDEILNDVPLNMIFSKGIINTNTNFVEANDSVFNKNFENNVIEGKVVIIESFDPSNVWSKIENYEKLTSVFEFNSEDGVGSIKKIITNERNYDFYRNLVQGLEFPGFKLLMLNKRPLAEWEAKNVGYFKQFYSRPVDPTSSILTYGQFEIKNSQRHENILEILEGSEKEKLVQSLVLCDLQNKFVSYCKKLKLPRTIIGNLMLMLPSLWSGDKYEVAAYASSYIQLKKIAYQIHAHRKLVKKDRIGVTKKYISLFEVFSIEWFDSLEIEIANSDIDTKKIKSLLYGLKLNINLIKNDFGANIEFSRRDKKKIERCDSILDSYKKVTSVFASMIEIAKLIESSQIAYVNKNQLNKLENLFEKIIDSNTNSIDLEIYKQLNVSQNIYKNIIVTDLISEDNLFVKEYNDKLEKISLILSVFDKLVYVYEG